MLVRRLILVLFTLAAAASACSDVGGTGAPSGSRDAFCGELRAVVEADLTVFDPLAPATPEDTVAATARLADAAPAVVAAEMRLLADTFAEVTAILDEFDASDPQVAQQINALGIDQEEVTAAQAAVTGYALDVCRIDLAAINAASVPSTSAPANVPPTTVRPGPTAAPTTG